MEKQLMGQPVPNSDIGDFNAWNREQASQS